MATPYDFGLIEQVSALFPFLLSFAIVFAVLNKSKWVESVALQGFIAFVISLMVIMSSFVTRLINEIAPWFILMFVFLILLIMLFMIFGVKETTFTNAGKDPAVMWTLIIISIIIIVANVSKVYYVEGQRLDPSLNATISEEEAQNYVPFQGEQIYWLYHPKILGLIMIFLIGVFSIRLLSGTNPDN